MDTSDTSCAGVFQNLDNNSLSIQVFNNQIIVYNILENVRGDINDRLKLRLVNKSFNLATIHAIRKEHRTVEFHKTTRCNDRRRLDPRDPRNNRTEPCQNCSVYLNSEKLNAKNLFSYAWFLKQTMRIMVVKIIIGDSGSYCFNVHNVVQEALVDPDFEKVEEFVGADNLNCFGCEVCEDIALNCKVYGPVQINSFRPIMRQKHHFDVLQIKDSCLYLLWDEKKENPAIVTDVINSNIT